MVFSDQTSTNGAASDLGAQVRALRHERGLTLKDLGRLAGLSHPFLSQVERGLARPSVGSVERVAAALDVSLAQLWAQPRRGDAIHVLRRDEGDFDEVTGLRDLGGDTGTPILREWSART